MLAVAFGNGLFVTVLGAGVIPTPTSPSFPVTVEIEGFGTTRNLIYSTSVPADFTGNLKFKCWGTIFAPKAAQEESPETWF